MKSKTEFLLSVSEEKRKRNQLLNKRKDEWRFNSNSFINWRIASYRWRRIDKRLKKKKSTKKKHHTHSLHTELIFWRVFWREKKSVLVGRLIKHIIHMNPIKQEELHLWFYFYIWTTDLKQPFFFFLNTKCLLIILEFAHDLMLLKQLLEDDELYFRSCISTVISSFYV